MKLAKTRFKRPPTRLNLTLQYAANEADTPKHAAFARWVRRALRPSIHAADITLRLVGLNEGQALNQTWRERDTATNVLSFPLTHEEGVLQGDLVMCTPVIALEASEQGIALEAHYAHLTLHGVLHLQGYDHEDEQDANIMETLETTLMTGLGYADPYLLEKT